MSTFFKAAMGSFVGKILATAFIAACIFMGIGGPDKWIAYLIDGTPEWVTPHVARMILLGLAGLIALLLFSSFFQSNLKTQINADAIEFGLAVNGLRLFADKLGKRKYNIQIGVEFENKSAQNIRYFIDSMFVSIDGETLPSPTFTNQGLVLRPNERDTFRYDTFKNLELPPQCEILVSINASYGAPSENPVRHLKREYRATLRTSATNQNLNWAISGDDFDLPV